MHFLKEIWARQREYTIAALGDLWKTTVLLCFCLLVFYGITEVGRRFGYSAARLDVLEVVDFGVAVVTLPVFGYSSIGRLWVSRNERTRTSNAIRGKKK
jgi:hypothetical protein